MSDIVEAQNGDKLAMEKLINVNNGLIWSLAKRFKDRGYEMDDLYQVAVMGFIKAIKKFDTSFDVKLSTYAVPYILGEIRRYMQIDGSIKISRSIKELQYKISEIQKEFSKKGKEPTIEEHNQLLLPLLEVRSSLLFERVSSVFFLGHRGTGLWKGSGLSKSFFFGFLFFGS